MQVPDRAENCHELHFGKYALLLDNLERPSDFGSLPGVILGHSKSKNKSGHCRACVSSRNISILGMLDTQIWKK